MTARTSRTITISVIWIAIDIFLTFGVPNYHMESNDFEPFAVFCILVSISAAMVSTVVIWRSGRKKVYTGNGFDVVRSAQPIEPR